MKNYRPFLIAAFVGILTLSAFWGVRQAGFVWDDGINIEDNRHLNSGRLSGVLNFWQQPYKGLYIPLTYSVWAGLAYMTGTASEAQGGLRLDPTPFHMLNVVVHGVCAILVFVMLRRLTGHDWGSAGGALLFALHPVQVEPVVWVTGLKDVLSGFFSLVALWQYLVYASPDGVRVKGAEAKGRKAKKPRDGVVGLGFKGRALPYAVASVSFVLAMLAKPAAVVVPLVAWVMDHLVLRRSWRESVVGLVGWVVLAVPVVVLTKMVQPDEVLEFVTPLWARPLVAADAVAFYLYKVVFPMWLGPDYGRIPGLVIERGWMYYSWVVPAGVLGLAWWGRERWPWLVASVAIFVIGILPVSGLISFGFQKFSTVADRYLYLSMLGPAAALAYFLKTSRPAVLAAIMLLLTVLAIKSSIQVRHWRDSETLFRHTLGLNPNSWMAHYNLGHALAKSDALEDSAKHYRENLRIRPNSVDAHINLANVLARQNKVDEALKHYHEAIRINPGAADAHYNLGKLLARLDKSQDAKKHYEEAIRTDPDDGDIHYNLANLLVRQGNPEEALKHYQEALRINPFSVDALINQANVLVQKGQVAEAVALYQRALRIQPNSSGAHFNLANVLVQQGRMQDAITQYRIALEITPNRSEVHFNLAKTLAMQGQLNQAERHFAEVLRLEPQFVEAHHNLGRVLAAQGQLQPAIDRFRQALRIQPHFAEARVSLAQALAEQGKKDEAIREYNEAMRIMKSGAAPGPGK